jgi:hypothetical protein
MRQCIAVEYEDAAEMVAWDEGEYVASTMTTEELLRDEIGLEAPNEEAFSYFVTHLPDYAWVDVDYYSLHPRQTLMYGWERFAHAVKHRTRYLFFPPADPGAWAQHDEIRPEQMLDELGSVIRSHRLVKTLPAGTMLYRVRPHDRVSRPATLSELASPPAERVLGANRMSPAGISMLYAGESPQTALEETQDAVGQQGSGTLATLETTAPLRIADFVRLPRLPGFFTNRHTREERGRIQFLHAFAREISRPLTARAADQIEYVPTQVVTEYLRFRFRAGRRPLDGIRYRSAKNDGGVNVALFLDHADFAPLRGASAEPTPLRLVSHRRVSVRTRR